MLSHLFWYVFLTLQPQLSPRVLQPTCWALLQCKISTDSTSTLEFVLGAFLHIWAIPSPSTFDLSVDQPTEPRWIRLQDVVHSEKRLYLVLDLDLKKHMDSCPEFSKDPRLAKLEPKQQLYECSWRALPYVSILNYASINCSDKKL